VPFSARPWLFGAIPRSVGCDQTPRARPVDSGAAGTAGSSAPPLPAVAYRVGARFIEDRRASSADGDMIFTIGVAASRVEQCEAVASLMSPPSASGSVRGPASFPRDPRSARRRRDHAFVMIVGQRGPLRHELACPGHSGVKPFRSRACCLDDLPARMRRRACRYPSMGAAGEQ